MKEAFSIVGIIMGSLFAGIGLLVFLAATDYQRLIGFSALFSGMLITCHFAGKLGEAKTEQIRDKQIASIITLLGEIKDQSNLSSGNGNINQQLTEIASKINEKYTPGLREQEDIASQLPDL